MNPLVSIIITTKNEETVLKKLLYSVKKQQYKNYEIILVDNNSKDKTRDIAKKFNIRIFNWGPERSAQRNFGASKSKGKYLLFLDADMIITSNAVKECVESVKSTNKTEAVVIPEISVASNFWENAKTFERSFYNLKGDEVTDAARFFSKRIFLQCGGYDKEITGPEDWDITDRIRKAGYNIARIEAKIYHHERIPSLFSLMQKKFYYGLGVHRYIKKQGLPMLGPKTVYFLRPIFYQNLDKIFSHPLLSLGMLIMLSCELLAGGVGYLVGRRKKL